jgi:hypothetical protein
LGRMIGIIHIIKWRHHHIDQLSFCLIVFWGWLEDVRAKTIKIILNIDYFTVLYKSVLTRNLSVVLSRFLCIGAYSSSY